MTKTKARRVLGISNSAGLKSARRVYRDRCQKIQLRLVPGNAIQDRQKAQETLVELTAAWRTLNATPTGRSRPTARRKPDNRRKPASQPATANVSEDLASAWDDLFDTLPLPAPVVVLLLLATIFIAILSLFR